MATLETDKIDTLRLLVLVPHPDARLPLRTWSAALFAAGIEGAWSFPWVSPLATLKRHLGEGELKRLGHALREQILKCSNDGKIRTGPPVTAAFPGSTETAILGPVLNIEIPAPLFSVVDAEITHLFSPLIIGAALLSGPVAGDLPPPPPVSFRAAALANMS
ncbi:MAG: hypothetical protein LBH97_05270, partial [Treponema sp.]|nr:hypothetical protein [Treponema sp.]